MKSHLLASMVLLATPIFAFAANNADDFSIITQKNIFVRDRRPPPDPNSFRNHNRDEPRPARVPDPPGKNIVLRGVVIEDNELHAYVEDTRSGEVTRLLPGDKIADGRVSDIAIDAIQVETNGNLQWVDIGQNMYGAIVAPPAPTTAPSGDGSTTSTSTTQPAGADPALSTIEQRLRERRMRNTRK